MSILVVDDDPTNLQLLKATLKRLGAELRLARSGEEALAQARQHRPTLVLLDVMMSGIDGFETCRRLNADPACADAAVVFLSALDDARDKVQGLSVGAVDYIAKPFQPQEVLARVQTHLTLQQLKAELAERNRQLAAANQQILEAVAEGICGFHHEGRVSFANPAACQLTGTCLYSTPALNDEAVGAYCAAPEHRPCTHGSPESSRLRGAPEVPGRA